MEIRKFLLFILLPYLIWLSLYTNFWSGTLHLESDAVSYFEHIGFYTDNLSQGVYPLWHPFWENGSPYNFFLRRIGDVNPFYLIITLLKICGVSHQSAYLIFLAGYYFLGMYAFYLIACILFRNERIYASIAYMLLLFSNFGSQLFNNYIILIFVPIIWFFYFLLSFFHGYRRHQFLGIFFCLGIIFTTYIPFYFLTIFAIFSILAMVIYFDYICKIINKSQSFITNNRLLSSGCMLFLCLSLLPGYFFYKESKAGEFVMPNRNAGADVASAVAVSIKNVASGDIVNHGFFDRIFSSHSLMTLADFFIPIVFFSILLCVSIAKINRMLIFLFLNTICLLLITITQSAHIHQFLYDHVYFFKFIRNIYYFFWLAILPMAILWVASALRSFFNELPLKAIPLTIWITVIHAILIIFLLFQQNVIWQTWAAIILSWLFFIVAILGRNPLSLACYALILTSIVLQSAAVTHFVCQNTFFKGSEQFIPKIDYNHPYKTANIQLKETSQKDAFIKNLQFSVYYSSSYFALLFNNMTPDTLDFFLNHKFILYDQALPYSESAEGIKKYLDVIRKNQNIAYIPNSQFAAEDLKRFNLTNDHPQFITKDGPSFKVIRFTANDLVIKTNLKRQQFLVIHDAYNSQWHAFVNNQPTKLYRANIAFKGVWIPAGESTVALHFANPIRYFYSYTLIIIFAGTLIILLFFSIKDLSWVR